MQQPNNSTFERNRFIRRYNKKIYIGTQMYLSVI